MNKYVKYGLISLGALLAVLAALAAYIAATFDPNAYKPLIVKLVQEKKQRTLKIDGDIKLTFYPKLGADLGKISLSGHDSPEEFAAVDSARVSLALLPLLHHDLVVDQVHVQGLHAKLVRYKDGTTSIDDLLSKDEKEQKQFKFDIESIDVSDTVLTVDDQKAGRTIAVSGLALKTGRLADGKPSDIDLKLKLQADKPKVNADVKLSASLLFEMEAKHFRLDKLDAEVKGEVDGISNLAAGLKGNVDYNGTAQSLSADKLALEASGKQGETEFKAELNATLAGSPDVMDLRGIKASLAATSPATAGKKLSADLTGTAHIDLKAQNVAANIATKLDQSDIKARLGMSRFDQPHYTFDIAIDRLDADRYMSHGGGAKTGKAAAPEKPLDLSALKKLDADGSLRIGAFTVANIKTSDVRMDIKAGAGKLDISPFAANLYQGNARGSAHVDASGAAPQFGLKQTLSGISIGPLLKDALDKNILDGKGNVSLDVNTRGATTAALKKALQGQARLELRDGAIKGIDIAATLRNAKAKLGALRGEQTQAANTAEKTDFSELKASFNIHNGIAHNDDLEAKSPLLRLAGNGDIDLGESRMNYLAKATVAATLEGQGGKELAALKGVTVPVRITGPFAHLGYSLDFNALAGGAVKQKLEEKKEEAKGRVEEKLKEGLKGLFK
ncbi:MAG: AsmA family protein [Sulfuricella sp.]|nr:AsmA family protein [Sulfuricella sp.]